MMFLSNPRDTHELRTPVYKHLLLFWASPRADPSWLSGEQASPCHWVTHCPYLGSSPLFVAPLGPRQVAASLCASCPKCQYGRASGCNGLCPHGLVVCLTRGASSICRYCLLNSGAETKCSFLNSCHTAGNLLLLCFGFWASLLGKSRGWVMSGPEPGPLHVRVCTGISLELLCGHEACLLPMRKPVLCEGHLCVVWTPDVGLALSPLTLARFSEMPRPVTGTGSYRADSARQCSAGQAVNLLRPCADHLLSSGHRKAWHTSEADSHAATVPGCFHQSPGDQRGSLSLRDMSLSCLSLLLLTRCHVFLI